jgi:hypothetical protein
VERKAFNGYLWIMTALHIIRSRMITKLVLRFLEIRYLSNLEYHEIMFRNFALQTIPKLFVSDINHIIVGGYNKVCRQNFMKNLQNCAKLFIYFK